MEIPAGFAAMSAIAVTPLCLFIVWEDLARMRIRNTAVCALLGLFLAIASATLPWLTILWHLGAMAIMFALAFAVFELGAIGGGDAKLLTAMAPFFWAADWNLILLLTSTIFLLSFALHRIARALGAAKVLPSWVSWSSKKRFPMGVPLAVTLLTYLCLGAWA